MSAIAYKGVEFDLHIAADLKTVEEVCNRCAFRPNGSACDVANYQCGRYGYYVCSQDEANLDKLALLKLRGEL